jgi:hypothetical protein
MAGGRPTKYTQERAEVIVQRVREGLSFSSACESTGVGRECGSNWRKQYLDFSDAVTIAEKESERELLGVLRKAAIGHESKTTKYTISDKDGEKVEETTKYEYSPDYAKWILARRFPDEWSDRSRIQQLAQAKFRESIQYLMAAVSDSAKVEISSALLAAGFEAGVDATATPAQASRLVEVIPDDVPPTP